MSFLDLDERLLELAEFIDIVYSPIVDPRQYPDTVDIALVEGAVSSEDDVTKITKVRAHTETLVSIGDCAVTGNVAAMRNPFTTESVMSRAYLENATAQAQIPRIAVPRLLRTARPVHEYVHVDVYLPGCPPSADTFYTALTALISGKPLDVPALTRFGA
jgi:NAD-reducing hydrogenase small subunit